MGVILWRFGGYFMAFWGLFYGGGCCKSLNVKELQGQKNRNIFQYISMDIEIGALSLTRPPIFQYPDEYKKAPDQRGNRRRRDAQRCTLIRSANHPPPPTPQGVSFGQSQHTRIRVQEITPQRYPRQGAKCHICQCLNARA